jgi:hypothetical protein
MVPAGSGPDALSVAGRLSGGMKAGAATFVDPGSNVTVGSLEGRAGQGEREGCHDVMVGVECVGSWVLCGA